ncbi:hypothetical protein ACP70R_037551 [Stipagrostis hirtigluma subsp. patula]
MATASAPPAAPTSTSASLAPPIHPYAPRLRFLPPPTASASPVSLVRGRRPVPGVRCRAAAGPSPPSSEPPPPSPHELARELIKVAGSSTDILCSPLLDVIVFLGKCLGWA